MQLKLCENIKNLRSEKGITQDALAEKMGVSIQAVSKWENGNSCPDISLLPVLAEFFGVSVDFLLTGKETEIAKPNATDGANETNNANSENNADGADDFPFPDDGVYRVAQFCGSKLIKSGECDGEKSFTLDFSDLGKTGDDESEFVFNIMGSAEIEGADFATMSDSKIKGITFNVGGNMTAAGSVAGMLNVGGSLECGDIAGNVAAVYSVSCGNIAGNVKSDGYVECGDVAGNVDSRNYVECGNVGGDVTADDYVECDDIEGNVTADGYVECGDVGANVSACDYVECGDVDGNVSASDYVECGNVGENVSAGDCVTCGNVGGSVAAGDYINAQSVKGSGFDGNFVTDFVGDMFRNMFGSKKNNFGNWQQGKNNAQNEQNDNQKNERPKKKLSYAHPMTYVFDLGTAGDIRFSDNTNYGDSTISTRQVCVDFSSYIWQSENPPEVGDTVRVTGKLISPIDIDKMLVGIVDDSWEANNWLALNCDGQNRLKQNVYVERLKAGEPFELDVSLTVKQKMKGSFKIQLAYGEQNGGCVTMESQKVNDVFVGDPIKEEK